jgi:hypothetical protein
LRREFPAIVLRWQQQRALSEARSNWRKVSQPKKDRHDQDVEDVKRATHSEEKSINPDPKINDLGRAIEDDFATIRENYGMPIPLSSHEYI